MSDATLQNSRFEIINHKPFTEIYLVLDQLKSGVWFLGIPSWLFGLTDRVVVAFADGYVSAIEFVHFATAFLFLAGWLCLKPGSSQELSKVTSEDITQVNPSATDPLHEAFLEKAQMRMAELHDHHLIRQEYVLPFSYVCQIYHLLNLKHLESVHSFSLNNLKVIKVNHIQPTDIGGMVKFQTVLDSPLNALRIWRQPIVEVELTLHTPYTVELSIPVYNGKRMTVIFNAIPLSSDQHKLFIDIYSDLKWPKPLLQVLLHIASCLTLFEDLPYLRRLAERRIHRLISLNKISNHETMWLFKRFVDLYGAGIAPSKQKEPVAVDS